MADPEVAPVRGPDAVRRSLIQSATQLMAMRSPRHIPGRELAKHAGVNYGLIHHYFGTKDEVLRQSIQLHRDRFFAATAGAGRGPAFFSPSDHPGYVRAITRAALDGDLRADDARYPVVANMLDVLTEPGMDPGHERAVRVAIAAVVAAQLAWALFTPMLEQGLGVALADLEPWAASMLRELLRSPLSGTTGQG